MGRKIGTNTGAIKERQRMQQEIEEQFGVEAVQKAMEQWCSVCSEPHCFLCPLTTKGEVCPYFKEKENEE